MLALVDESVDVLLVLLLVLGELVTRPGSAMDEVLDEVDGLVDVDEELLDGLVDIELEESMLAVVLLIVRIEEQVSRSAEALTEALPMPLALPDTLADGDASRQVIRTLSPLFRSLRLAAALESTLSVRLLAAPVVPAEGRRVTVRALWSAETTSAVT